MATRLPSSSPEKLQKVILTRIVNKVIIIEYRVYTNILFKYFFAYFLISHTEAFWCSYKGLVHACPLNTRWRGPVWFSVQRRSAIPQLPPDLTKQVPPEVPGSLILESRGSFAQVAISAQGAEERYWPSTGKRRIQWAGPMSPHGDPMGTPGP